MHKILLMLCMICLLIGAKAQPVESMYTQHTSIQQGDTLRYRQLLPIDFNRQKKYPVVLFLHGAGERGSDNKAQLIHGAKLFADSINRLQYPAIVIFPQCPANDFWPNIDFNRDSTGKPTMAFSLQNPPGRTMKLVINLMDSLIGSGNAKTNQIYVMGLSMGGMGTFEILRHMKGTFAAAIPICGGGNVATASTISDANFWVFHGAKDNVVPLSFSETMVNGLRKIKKEEDVKFTVYPDANHNSWDAAFAEPDLLPWLFSQKKKLP